MTKITARIEKDFIYTVTYNRPNGEKYLRLELCLDPEAVRQLRDAIDSYLKDKEA